MVVETCFAFYKVGKASASLEFKTIIRMSRDVLLADLKKMLINQHIKGVDLVKRFPTYDVLIHAKKNGNVFTALTQLQWVEVSKLLTDGYFLLGNMIHIHLFLEGCLPVRSV